MANFIKHKMRSKTPGQIVKWVILGIIAMVGIALLLGYGIMWLWNWLMPDMFGLATLTYWQAVGLFVLLKILLGGCGGGNKRHGPSKNPDSSCHKRSKGDFLKWKHYDRFWKEEGEQYYQKYMERMDDENNNETKEP